MLTRNYYVVLGVPANESSVGIRRAFRELALRYHPDRAGAQGTQYFQELTEAYEVLSDAKRRASYDEGLRHAGDVDLPAPPPVRPAGHSAPEPLVPGWLSLLRDFWVTQPTAAEVREHIQRSFTDPEHPKSRRLDALNLELLLSLDEAARGGVVTLGVPVFYPCRACHGAGVWGSYVCQACDGRGMVEEEEAVRLSIPSFVRDGTLLQAPLRGLGIHNMYLQVHIRVGE